MTGTAGLALVAELDRVLQGERHPATWAEAGIVLAAEPGSGG